uniref:FBA_2 domain-containing protein n=2 Tax=Caenorhabditis tropicalis TaxID=1561998 RepID=A0A1I7V1E3_9PELO
MIPPESITTSLTATIRAAGCQKSRIRVAYCNRKLRRTIYKYLEVARQFQALRDDFKRELTWEETSPKTGKDPGKKFTFLSHQIAGMKLLMDSFNGKLGVLRVWSVPGGLTRGFLRGGEVQSLWIDETMEPMDEDDLRFLFTRFHVKKELRITGNPGSRYGGTLKAQSLSLDSVPWLTMDHLKAAVSVEINQSPIDIPEFIGFWMSGFSPKIEHFLVRTRRPMDYGIRARETRMDVKYKLLNRTITIDYGTNIANHDGTCIATILKSQGAFEMLVWPDSNGQKCPKGVDYDLSNPGALIPRYLLIREAILKRIEELTPK